MEFPLELFPFIDTPEFQRLRGVRQLGTAFYVYPGATHTRFEHSLGTCWLTSRLLHHLDLDCRSSEGLTILAAALLHDVTHIPYGHTLEDERRIFDRHDTPERIRDFLPRGLLGRRLSQARMLEPVLAILTDPKDWKQQVFSGSVAADLLDYVARDALYCGLCQRYDQRIFSLFRLQSGRLFLEAQKHGVVRQDALSEIVHLLRIRYFLSERVYFHHSKTVAGAMVSRCVEEAVKRGLTLDEIAGLTDEGLLSHLEFRFGQERTVEAFLSALRARQLYKRVYLLTSELSVERREELVKDYHQSSQLRGAAETEIARAAKLEPHELIVYCPALKMQLKEGGLAVRLGEGVFKTLDRLPVDEIGVLQERHRRLWRFYVFLHPERMSKAERVAEVCEAYFGEANHLPRFRSGQLYLGL